MISARRRGICVLKLAAELAFERTGAAAANEEIEGDEPDQDGELGASGGPEEAFGRGDPDGVEHEDEDRERDRAGEQAKDEQKAAERRRQSDHDPPEQAGLVADVFEDGGKAREAGAAEPAEQLLASMWNEDRAETDAQRRLRTGREAMVDAAERGKVEARRRIGHGPPWPDGSGPPRSFGMLTSIGLRPTFRKNE